jgi:hypothetical protein
MNGWITPRRYEQAVQESHRRADTEDDRGRRRDTESRRASAAHAAAVAVSASHRSDRQVRFRPEMIDRRHAGGEKSPSRQPAAGCR